MVFVPESASADESIRQKLSSQPVSAQRISADTAAVYDADDPAVCIIRTSACNASGSDRLAYVNEGCIFWINAAGR